MRITMWVMLLAGLGCCAQLGCEALRILALFPLNSRSHSAMCDRLAKGLAARGHQLDVYSHYPPKSKLPANYRHHSLEGTLHTLTNNMSYEAAVHFQAANAREVLDTVGDPSCRLMRLPVFRELLAQPPPGYDLVIVETFVADCYLAWGRHLNAPMVGVMTTSMMDWYNEPLGNPFNTAVTPALGSRVFAPMSFLERLQNTITGALVRLVFAREITKQSDFVDELFGPGYPDVVALRRDLDLVLVNSHYSLDGIRAYTPAVVPVAGIHIDDSDNSSQLPKDVQKWLDDSEHGCVYFSFGSMLKIESFPEPVLRAFYAAFRSIAPVRVLLKIAKPEELPAGLPSNVMTRSWFPQLRVLKHKHTKAFVTHGGLMSAQESIHAGVPMLGVPVFGDQHNNVEINVRKGIATSVQLAGIDDHKFTAAIKEVLYKPSYRRKMEKLSRTFVDRPMKPLDTAVYWVEYVGRHGKNCLRSPLVDMPWWQAQLLDVYAVFLSVLLAVLFALKFLLKKLLSMCCSKNPSDPTSRKSKSKAKKER